MMAAPRCCTVGMNVPANQSWSPPMASNAGVPATVAWNTSGYWVAEWLPQMVMRDTSDTGLPVRADNWALARLWSSRVMAVNCDESSAGALFMAMRQLVLAGFPTTSTFTPLDALSGAVVQTWDMSAFSLRMLGKMILGELSWRNLSGPVAIADYAGQSARVGWQAYLAFIALISVSLGVLNLLPVPVLDGGHLIYYGLEAALRRPLPERFVEVTQKVGLGIVGAMMLLALFNDITRLIGS